MGKIVPAGPERSPLPPPPSRITRLERRIRHARARRARARSARLGSGPVTHEERAMLTFMLWGSAIGWASLAISVVIIVVWGVSALLR